MKAHCKTPTRYDIKVAAIVPTVEFETNVESGDRRLAWTPKTGALTWREAAEIGDDSIAVANLREFKRRLRDSFRLGRRHTTRNMSLRARYLIANYFCLFVESVDPLKRRLRTNDWELINARINDVFERINNGTTDR